MTPGIEAQEFESDLLKNIENIGNQFDPEQKKELVKIISTAIFLYNSRLNEIYREERF